MQEAVGDPETGYYIPTPYRPLRRWPVWSLRPHLENYPHLARRWDQGGLFDERHIDELGDFLKATHCNVGNDVFVFEIPYQGARFFPSVVSWHRNKGHVSKWLDSLSQSDQLVFPEVISLKLAQMLHRRGFVVGGMADDGAPNEDWLPCHRRGFDEREIE